MNRSRRKFVLASAALAGVGAYAFVRPYLAEGLSNPCLGALPPELANHEVLQSAWAGLRVDQVWDCHTHVAGVGANASGIVIHPDMDHFASPLRYGQKLAYMNAACASGDDTRIDVMYVERLQQLVADMAPGFKAMLLAFDWFHDTQGKPVRERSTFYVPNEYVHTLVKAAPERFEWLASVHPYREDAVTALESAVKNGARGIKWLPAAQGMDPSSKQCLPFYDALARLKMPLLVHCGEEKAVHGGETQGFGNPLYMRVPLERGVTVIVAHCASLGRDIDLDKGGEKGPRVPSFELFARLMDDPQYKGKLFGDISAVTQVNRNMEILHTLLRKTDWHDRLLHGSDYPLTGVMPLISTGMMVDAGLLDAAAREPLMALRRHNPLLYDFALKRHLRWQGQGFAPSVFETRRVFKQ